MTFHITKHTSIANKANKTFRYILTCEHDRILREKNRKHFVKIEHANMNQKFANKHFVTNYTKNYRFRLTKLK